MFWKRKIKDRRCPKCGRIHLSWPALTFDSPIYYDQLSEKEKVEIANLNSDFCTIKKEESYDRFIRVCLSQKITSACETLEYGLWVSLSEKSFFNYIKNFENPALETGYFGWLCNNIPGYQNTCNIPCDVVTKAGNIRPEIFPHKGFDHPFVQDYYKGISKKEAQKRVDQVMKNKL